MESLSDLNLSSSLSEDLICLFNLFALFLLFFICLAVSGSGVGCEGLVGRGGGGLLGFGGLVRGAGAVSKAISSAFLNLQYLFILALLLELLVLVLSCSPFYMCIKKREKREKREKKEKCYL